MLSAALQQLAAGFHAVADAADRLQGVKVEAEITLKGESDRARAERIARGQAPEELKAIIKAVRRDLDRR